MPPTYTQYDFHVFYGTNISVTLCWYAFANYCIRTWYFLTITYSLFTRLNQGALRLTAWHLLTYNCHFCWAWYFSTITSISMVTVVEFSVVQLKFNRFLHLNKPPKRIFWYLIRPFDWRLSKIVHFQF